MVVLSLNSIKCFFLAEQAYHRRLLLFIYLVSSLFNKKKTCNYVDRMHLHVDFQFDFKYYTVKLSKIVVYRWMITCSILSFISEVVYELPR